MKTTQSSCGQRRLTFAILVLASLIVIRPSLEYIINYASDYFYHYYTSSAQQPPLQPQVPNPNNRSKRNNTSWLDISTDGTHKNATSDSEPWFSNATVNDQFASLLHTEVTSLPGQLWVKFKAPLKERLSLYNRVIELQRQAALTDLPSQLKWPAKTSKVFYNRTNYLRKLSGQLANQTMRTIYLQHFGPPLNSNLSSDLLVDDYHDWTVSSRVCEWLSVERHRWFYYNSQCTTASQSKQQLQGSPSFAYAYAAFQMVGGAHLPYTSFIHVLVGGFIIQHGDVFVSDFKIVAPTCRKDYDAILPPMHGTQEYDEVFVISQFWGEGHFHYMMEDMPRLAPFLTFLRNHPTIVIQVHTPTAMLTALFVALRLDPSRMVSGNVRGRIVYLPRSSMCGHLLMSEGQLLAHEYRTYIENSLPGDKLWRSVVFIRRSTTRFFVKQNDIEQTTSALTTKYGLHYEVFADNPPLSPQDTMLIFYRARVIVAPHGAGLSSMLFSRPGTVVIEIMCQPPTCLHCYLGAAYRLGHRYHGIPSRKGCHEGIHVEPDDVAVVLESFLQVITSEL